MKMYTLSVQISAGVVLALLSCGISNGHAASATPVQNKDNHFAQSSQFQPVTWEQYKIEKLQHAYRLLEHADGDYSGHRDLAMRSIRKAAEVLGVELRGEEHAEESQWRSDRRLHEAKHLLEDLVGEGQGKEQPHIHHAIKELNKALALK
jgi:hypothetical protein